MSDKLLSIQTKRIKRKHTESYNASNFLCARWRPHLAEISFFFCNNCCTAADLLNLIDNLQYGEHLQINQRATLPSIIAITK
jgi:hypothetical protein